MSSRHNILTGAPPGHLGGASHRMRCWWSKSKSLSRISGSWHLSSTMLLIEGSLEVKLPTIWTDGRVREEKRREEERRKKKEDQKRQSRRRKKIQVCEKVGKSQNTVFFQWFVAPEDRKVGSLKRRVRGHVVGWEMKSCTTLWREARF